MYKQDEVGNLVIVKESTHDMITRETVVLQSHVDMVHEKIMMLNLIFKFWNQNVC